MSGSAPRWIVAFLALAAGQALHAAEYQVDGQRSVVLVRVWKEGPASVFAHDHVAHATKLTGTVRWDPSNPDASSVIVEVDANGISMDEPGYRRRLEMPAISDVDRRTIQNTMRGPKQLDVATFPTITFRSTRVAGVAAGKVRITGSLTLHGQTREVTLPAVVEKRGAYLHATGSLRFRQTDFGITPYSFGSAVRNGDEVEMQLELIAK
jgi:polyisoprenoid-binding protein YceI